jgi:prepilin-type N-terminal cleavage/methylation domain-containing protein
MKNKIKRVNGFTLVEIMIVVSIIGLLAAIAIPNFLKREARLSKMFASIIFGRSVPRCNSGPRN